MITIEACLFSIMGWGGFAIIAILLERLCSCYFPFLLSARFYVTIKKPKLCNILISPYRNRESSSQTAYEDRNKLPLSGCIYCAVIFPWLFCEIIILLIVLVLVILKSDFLYSPFMTNLISICVFLYTNEYFWIFIAGMFLLYQIDYSLGLRHWQKCQKR
jgi:hypothetical protein